MVKNKIPLLNERLRIDIDALPNGRKERETFITVDAEGVSETIWLKQKRRATIGDLYDKNRVKGIVYEVSANVGAEKSFR